MEENPQYVKLHVFLKLHTQTLLDRLNGRPARASLRANSHKLNEAEENLLVQLILDLDKRESPPPQRDIC